MSITPDELKRLSDVNRRLLTAATNLTHFLKKSDDGQLISAMSPEINEILSATETISGLIHESAS